MECCVTRNCEAFILIYGRLNVCANVKMGTVVVGYGIAVYGRLSFTNDIFVFFKAIQLVFTFDQSSLTYLLRVATRFWGHCG